MKTLWKQKVIRAKWDMDNQAVLKIEHNSTIDNVRITDITIKDDFGGFHLFSFLKKYKDFCYIDDKHIILERESNGYFDNSNFDDNSIDRVVLTIFIKENNL